VKRESSRPPSVKQRKLLNALAEREKGMDVWIDSREVELCEESGWVESNPVLGWVLTDLGKRVLG
jgi:hypothetical protein